MSIRGEGYTQGRMILRLRFHELKGNALIIEPENIAVEEESLGNIPVVYAPKRQHVNESTELVLYFRKEMREKLLNEQNGKEAKHSIKVTFENAFFLDNESCLTGTISAEYTIP